ncbi:nucleotidyltransferase domain protein [Dictyocaulus viviparus]|uniref:Nucleotidyltransferase domain protein n=1 Tax=Dictyocaulus viviparus TaxID=29172 RepID=A0A0D8Y4Y0_DICVI|nr:nucleotidyltransferase domain protein [Dictyocaulus viviparus]
MSEEESDTAKLLKQYEYYIVEPNIQAIKQYRKQYSGLFENPTYASKLCELSREIHQYFYTYIENDEDYQTKMNSMEKVRKIIMKYRSWRFELFPSGSTVTGLATKGSDLDLILWCPDAQTIFYDEETAVFNILRLVRHFLLIDVEIRDELDNVCYVEAKVPILKIKFQGGLSIDLSCCVAMFISGVLNSYLIRGFTLWDAKVAPLCVLIKEWARCHGIKNSTNGGFNSYALVLLIIHFLQCVANPPILPNLPKLFPKMYGLEVDSKFLLSEILSSNKKPIPYDRGGKLCFSYLR